MRIFSSFSLTGQANRSLTVPWGQWLGHIALPADLWLPGMSVGATISHSAVIVSKCVKFSGRRTEPGHKRTFGWWLLIHNQLKQSNLVMKT